VLTGAESVSRVFREYEIEKPQSKEGGEELLREENETALQVGCGKKGMDLGGKKKLSGRTRAFKSNFGKFEGISGLT